MKNMKVVVVVGVNVRMVIQGVIKVEVLVVVMLMI